MSEVQEFVPAPRPLVAIDLPKQAARNNLRKRLVEDFDMEEDAAHVVSQAVVDPAAARAVLKNPLHISVRHGLVKVIRTPIFIPLSTVSPINPRIGNRRRAINGMGGDGKPLRYRSAEDGQSVLVIECASKEEMQNRISNAAIAVREEANAELHDPIFHQGVPQALTLFCARIEHRDGSPHRYCLLAADGSSRTSHAQHIIGMDHDEAVYRWPDAPAQEWNGFLGRIVKTQERSEHEVTEEHKAKHRSLVAMADIVIGIEALPGENLDAEESYRSLIGGIHVTRPKEWGTVWEHQTIAEAILKSMREAGVISREEAEYMENGSAEAANALGYSEHMDERATRILAKLMSRNAREAVSEGYLTIVRKARLGSNDRSDIAAALMMEGYEAALGERALKTVRSVLERGLRLTEFRDGTFDASGSDPDDLLEEALESLQRTPEVISDAARELGVIGLYWMAQKGGLKRETVTTGNDAPSEILRRMMRSPLGLRQLHRAVVDGRAGKSHILLVDEDGNVIRDATREARVANNEMMRRQFGSYPEAVEDVEPSSTSRSVRPPAAQVAAAVEQLQTDLREMKDTMQRIEQVTLGDRPYVDVRGVQAGTARVITGELFEITGKLNMWASVNDRYLRNLDDRGDDETGDLFADTANEEAA